jgi:Sulfotransferase family
MEDALSLRLSKCSVRDDRIALLGELSFYARALVGEARRTPYNPITAEERTRTLEWLKCPVFVCGHHRSGTTLMQRLLDGHPDLVVLPSEGSYFTSFHYVARPSPTPAALDRFIAAWISRLVDPNFAPHFKIGRAGPHHNPGVQFAERVLAWCAALQDVSPKVTPFEAMLALVAAFRDVIAPRATPLRWVEKTPLNELIIDQLAAFPEARFIHMVREPSATLESLLASYRNGGVKGASAANFADSIGRSLRRARTNAQRLGNRYLVVRYEDLVAHTESEMSRVRAHLGISAHASLVTPTDCGKPVRSNSSFDVSAPGVVSRPSRIHVSDARYTPLVSVFCASAAGHFAYHVPALTGITQAALRVRHLPPILIRRLLRWIMWQVRSQPIE